MAAANATALEAALAAVRAARGAEELVQRLEAERKGEQTLSTDDRPLADRLAGCRGWIARGAPRATTTTVGCTTRNTMLTRTTTATSTATATHDAPLH